MSKISKVIGIIVLSIPLLIEADKGMMPVIPNISIYEPGQKAIIAWNGESKMEILILAVDAYADTECKVIEILPLPSEPKVDTGSVESFKSMQRLIMKHAPKPLYRGKGPPPPMLDGTEGVEILFHKKIGAHNITCAKALKYQEFVDWTYKFIKSQGIDTFFFPSELPYIIEEYLNKDIQYFVFDIVELGKNPSSIAPLIYEFASPYLFFPLRISRLVKGKTKIQLFLITEYPVWLPAIKPFEIGRYSSAGRYQMLKSAGDEIMFEITKEELRTISPLLVNLFSGNVWVTAMKFDGPAVSLTNDLSIREFYKRIKY